MSINTSKPYESKSDGDLKALAVDIVSGHAFSSLSLDEKEADLLPMIFMPLALGGPALLKWCSENQITVLYEYLEKASGKGINGRPMFKEMRVLNRTDGERLMSYVRQLQKVTKEFLRKTENSPAEGGKPDEVDKEDQDH